MVEPFQERWPPVYDAEELQDTIHRLIRGDHLAERFYRPAAVTYTICQGDIISLQSGVPLIAADGKPAIHGDASHWMVIGNTCDIERDLQDVMWTQLVPLVDLGTHVDVSEQELSDLRGYRPTRTFYVPPWSEETGDRHHIADFLRPVAIHKTALREVATVEASLEWHSWLLLHSCLVRFLARDDGRFD